MDFLWIGLGVIGFCLLAVLVTSIVCYFRMFYSPKRKALGPDEYAIPDGDIYEVFREDMIKWTKMIRAYPYKEYAIQSFDGLTLRAKYFECKPGAPIELMFHGYKGNAERDLNGGVERCFKLGHSALLIDHRAAGFSDGHVITFGILEKRDCLRWIEFAIKEFGEDIRLILTGISMGSLKHNIYISLHHRYHLKQRVTVALPKHGTVDYFLVIFYHKIVCIDPISHDVTTFSYIISRICNKSNVICKF